MEDDVDFERDFKDKIKEAMRELERKQQEEEWRRQNKKWDLLYLGKRKISKNEEKAVDNTRHWLWPENSFWALSYVLSDTGKIHQYTSFIAIVPFITLLIDQ